jgi:soluble lytic murein transglycosylase-like protein
LVAGAAALAPLAALVPVAGAYVVRPGDTLWGLSGRYQVPVSALADANHLRNPNRLLAGAKLVVPPRPAAVSSRLPARLVRQPDKLALRPRFSQWAHAYGVPTDLLEALTWWESGWQNDVVSSTGAVGIGQLMPATVDFVRNQLLHARLDPTRPDDNIRMSARFLRHLLDQTGGRADTAVAAYYQGLKSVTAGHLLDETRRYVAGVTALRGRFQPPPK